MTIPAYPLAWPAQFPRTSRREGGKFKTALAGAIKNVQTSIRLFATDSRKAVTDLVISSNVTLGAAKPADPGVSVWFTWDGLQVCIPVDRYTTVEGNLQAIHHIIEARRVELRHGTLALVRASFAGFLAIEDSSGKHWSVVLGVQRDVSTTQAKQAWLRKRSTTHPDNGGTPEDFARVQRAWDDCCREHHYQDTGE